MTTYKQAFPDFDFDPQLPQGFVDVSWHNDACPSWSYGTSEFSPTLYINYKDPALRECECGCFVVAHPADGDDVDLYIGDDLAEAIRICIDYKG